MVSWGCLSDIQNVTKLIEPQCIRKWTNPLTASREIHALLWNHMISPRRVTCQSAIKVTLKPHGSHGFTLNCRLWNCPLGTFTPQLKKWLDVLHCLKQLRSSECDKWTIHGLASSHHLYSTSLFHICHVLMEQHFTFSFPRCDPTYEPCTLQCDVHIFQSELGIKQTF